MMTGCRLGGEGAEGFLTRFREWRALGRNSAEIYKAECRHQGALLQTTKLKSSRCGIPMRLKK